MCGVKNYREARARELRTGDTFTTPWSPRGRTFTVDYPIWETHVDADGGTRPVIWFAGTYESGRRTERGAGQDPDGRVYILAEAPRDGDTFGALGEWVDADSDVSWDDWLDAEWCGETS